MRQFIFSLALFAFVSTAFAQSKQEKIDFLDMVNEHRFFADMPLYVYSSEADTLAKKRLETLKMHIDSVGFSGVRSNVREALHHRSDEDFAEFSKTFLHPSDSVLGWNSECSLLLMGSDSSDVPNPVRMSFRMWKNSPDHWSGIMDKDFKRLAFAYEFYEGGMIAVLVLWEGRKKKKETK